MPQVEEEVWGSWNGEGFGFEAKGAGWSEDPEKREEEIEGNPTGL
jgi:hypothetical protein